MTPKIDTAKIEAAVGQVELEFGPGGGEAKRRAAVALINAVVDIPWLPEPVEAVLFGLLVDAVVHLYNRWWGHNWRRQLTGRAADNGELATNTSL